MRKNDPEEAGTGSATVGPYTVSYAEPDSPFRIRTESRTVESTGVYELSVLFSSASVAQLPSVGFSWSHPMRECHLRWNTAVEGAAAIVPWKAASAVASRTTSHAPVYSILSLDGTNRLTFAVSDVFNGTVLRAQMIEERAELQCTVELLNTTLAKRMHHEVTIRIDVRAVPFHHSLAAVSEWWAALPGLEPLPAPAASRMPVYCTWYAYHQAVTAQDVERECRAAKALGMESVIVDDGWQTDDTGRGYAYCGDWDPTPTKFPDFAGHVRRVHRIGLKYILWFSVPFVGINSASYDRFRQKLLPSQPDATHWPLDPRWPDVREHLVNLCARFVTEYNLDGLKLDFVDTWKEPESDVDAAERSIAELDAQPAPEALRDNMTVAEAAALLMREIADTLRAINPDVMLEFRQPYIGPAMRHCGTMFRVGDVPNDFVSNRINAVDLRLLAGETPVHSDPIMWHPSDSAPSAALQLLHTLVTVPQISVRLGELSDEHLAVLRTYLAFWRAHRELLLGGSMTPLEPGAMYSQVKCRDETTCLVAVYGRTTVSLPRDLPERLILVNATMESCLWLDAEHHAGSVWSIDVTDCTGSKVCGESIITLQRAQALSVPAAGLAQLHRRRRLLEEPR